MTKKEKENMTVNICRTAEYYAYYRNTKLDKASAMYGQLMGKISLADSMGVRFNVYELVLNSRDVEQNPTYRGLEEGIYIEVVRDDGFRHLAKVRTEV